MSDTGVRILCTTCEHFSGSLSKNPVTGAKYFRADSYVCPHAQYFHTVCNKYSPRSLKGCSATPISHIIQAIEGLPGTHSVRVTEYEGEYLVSFITPIPYILKKQEGEA